MKIPKDFGRVYWSGGAGRPGQMGGWRYECPYCNLGDRRSADPSQRLCAINLYTHVLEIHSYEKNVKKFLESQP
jgi:hypothetical protein